MFRLSRVEKKNGQMIATNEQFQRKSIYLVDWRIDKPMGQPNPTHGLGCKRRDPTHKPMGRKSRRYSTLTHPLGYR